MRVNNVLLNKAKRSGFLTKVEIISRQAAAQTDYQILAEDIISRKGDGEDIHFFQKNEILNHWLESYALWKIDAWAKLPHLPVTKSQILKILSGNPSASNITNTFLFGDDFEGEKTPAVTFGLVCSVEYGQIEDLTKINAAVSDFNSWDPNFVVEVGDFILHGVDKATTLTYLDEVEASYDDLSMSRYYCLGNHDLDWLLKSEFFSHTGMSEKYYSFDVGDYHFIVLDPMYDVSGNDIENCYVTLGAACCFGGGACPVYVSDTQKTWLTNDLAGTSKKTFVFMEQHFSGTGSISNGAAVRTILENSGKVIACFSAQTGSGKETINGIDYYKMYAMDEAATNAYAKITIYTDDSIYVEGIGSQASYGSATTIDANKWNKRETGGTVSVANSEVTVHVSGATAHVGISGKTDFGVPIAMRTKAKRPEALDTNMRRWWASMRDTAIGAAEPAWPIEGASLYHWGTDDRSESVSNSTMTTNSQTYDGDYHIWDILIDTNTILKWDGVTIDTITTNVPDGTPQMHPFLYGRSGTGAPSVGLDVVVDWILVREYASPEPLLLKRKISGKAGIIKSVCGGIAG